MMSLLESTNNYRMLRVKKPNRFSLLTNLARFTRRLCITSLKVYTQIDFDVKDIKIFIQCVVAYIKCF